MKPLSAQTLPAVQEHALQPVAPTAAPAAHARTGDCKSDLRTEAGGQQQHPPVGASLCSHDAQGVHHSGHAKVCNFYDAAIVHQQVCCLQIPTERGGHIVMNKHQKLLPEVSCRDVIRLLLTVVLPGSLVRA